MSRMPRLLVVLVVFISVIAVALQLSRKLFSLDVYLVSVGILSLVLSSAVLSTPRLGRATIVLLLSLAILLRLGPYLALRFSVLPWGDPYSQYGVLMAFSSAGRITPLDEGGLIHGFRLGFYSGWPAVHVLGIALAETAAVNLFSTTLILPWAFYASWLLFGFLFVRRLGILLGLGDVGIRFALMTFTVAPFLPLPPIFNYQDLALALWAGILYVGLSRPRAASPILLILIGALIITHHYTSVVAATYLVAVAGLQALEVYRHRRIVRREAVLNGNDVPAFSLGLLALSGAVAWGAYYDEAILRPLIEPLKAMLHVLRSLSFRPSYPIQNYALQTLTPQWVLVLLGFRDLILALTAGAGLLLLMWKVPRSRARSFLVKSLAVLLLSVAFYVLFGPIMVEIQRAVSMWMYIIALLSGIAIAVFLSKPSLTRRLLVVGLSLSLVAGGFIGFWGHRYAPVHLYDPSVSFREAGEHPIEWRRVAEFVDTKIDLRETRTVLADDIFVTVLLLPVDYWGKVAGIGYGGMAPDDDTVTLVWNDLAASYIGSGASYLDPAFQPRDFRRWLELRPLVYDDGQLRLWR